MLDLHKLSPMLVLAVFLAGLVVRAVVGTWGYSGAGTPPMFGDFEAQRHWMEVTTALPMGDWYFQGPDNDLQYWGLDYPPLTALVSWGYGVLAGAVVPQLVALHSSRGHESVEGKSFMRGSVLLADVFLLFPALLLMTLAMIPQTKGKGQTQSQLRLLLLAVLAPALVLIDHGHFQYNGISIGLTLLAAAAILRDHNCLGSVLFCLSLNFKQMSLYHAPVFFVVLLRKCVLCGFEKSQTRTQIRGQIDTRGEVSCAFSPRPFLQYLSLIGGTVVATFTLLWLPFCLAPSTSSAPPSCSAVLLQILSRIFPFSRGIFEDKVANLWYLISVIFDYRTLVPQEALVKVSLALTITLLSPVLWTLGMKRVTPVRLLLGLVVCALAFFLAAFQVHEKSLLLALVPATLLVTHRPLDVCWFQLTGVMSLYPLLTRDGQTVPYWSCSALYICLSAILFLFWGNSGSNYETVAAKQEKIPVIDSCMVILRRVYFFVSATGVVLLHLAEALVLPPSHLPDLYPALFALFGCCSLLWNYVFFAHWLLLHSSEGDMIGAGSDEERTSLEKKRD